MGNPQPTVFEGPDAGDIYVGMIPLNASSEQKRAIETSVRDNPDSFVICTLGDALLIYGRAPRPDLYGANHDLETLGVRWYFPGIGNEFFPHVPARLQGYNITPSPSFRRRRIIVFSTTPRFNDLVDFAVLAFRRSAPAATAFIKAVVVETFDQDGSFGQREKADRRARFSCHEWRQCE